MLNIIKTEYEESFLTAILALTFIGAKAQSPNDDLVKVGDKCLRFLLFRIMAR
jgi:hypothetical protein